MPPHCCFFVDFETIGDGYVKSLCIKNVVSKQNHVIEVKPPLDWWEIVFKRMQRKYYYESPSLLKWSDGDICYEDWPATVLELIDAERDVVLVNTQYKYNRLVLECDMSHCFCV